MLIFLTNRIIQSFIVLLAMSLLVFAAVYAIGNPIDVLINPEASEEEKLKTIIEMLENKGYVSGIVATSSVVHATPAAFYAHSDDRYDYNFD